MNGFMRSILFVTDNFEYHGLNRQQQLLAERLTPDFPRLFSIRGPGPMQPAGIMPGGNRSRIHFPVENLFSLRRQLAADRPTLIHLWGLASLRALWWATLVKRSLLPPLMMTLQAAELAKRRVRQPERLLLDRVRLFVVASDQERDEVVARGLPAERVRVIAPGVPEPVPQPGDAALRAEASAGEGDCLFLSIGHFNTSYRSRESLWAFEIVRGIQETMRLTLIGDGAFRERIARAYYYATQPETGVRFLQARPDAGRLLLQADAALVGHRHSGGTYAVLEAMAAGRPVVANRLPHLEPLIRDGETGFLVPVGRPPGIARCSLLLARDPARRVQIGEAGREFVRQHHRVESMVAAYQMLYAEVAC